METYTITPTANIDVYKFGIYTIEMNTERFTVRITYESKRARFGHKQVCHWNFRRNTTEASVAAMQKYVADFMAKEDLANASKANKKDVLKDARENFVCPYTVGQIMYSSWGYDQTNIDFYQIVSIKGKKVVIREIAKSKEYFGDDRGTCMPVKDSFTGEETTRMITIRVWDNKPNYSIKKLMNWDGTAKHWSSYH